METEPVVSERPNLNDLQQRNAWFTSTPDPWEEIVRLSYGGDRTHAATVERRVKSAEPAQHAEMERKLIAALAHPELTGAARRFVCEMLGYIGSAACVPAVAPLLASERTADHARMALDGIADLGVDTAYRGALDKLHGAAKAGLIGSIGMRGDREAAGALRRIVADASESAEVRAVAARAVERLERKQEDGR